MIKINWSFIEPVRDQAARLHGDLPAQSAIVKLAEQQAEIERLREQNARLREALMPFVQRLEVLEETIAHKYAVGTDIDVAHLRAARAAILGDVKAEAACPAPDEAP